MGPSAPVHQVGAEGLRVPADWLNWIDGGAAATEGATPDGSRWGVRSVEGG